MNKLAAAFALFSTGLLVGTVATLIATPTPAWQQWQPNEQVIAAMIPGVRSAADVYAVEAGIDRDWVRIVYRVRFVDRQCTVLMGNGRAVMCGDGAFVATTPGVATP